jgi:hypothetical protein
MVVDNSCCLAERIELLAKLRPGVEQLNAYSVDHGSHFDEAVLRKVTPDLLRHVLNNQTMLFGVCLEDWTCVE